MVSAGASGFTRHQPLGKLGHSGDGTSRSVLHSVIGAAGRGHGASVAGYGVGAACSRFRGNIASVGHMPNHLYSGLDWTVLGP